MTVSTDPRKTGINAGMTLLAASAVAASVTGTTNETTLATVTIPAGAMGLNGGILIKETWSYTNSANNKTVRVRLGGISGSIVMGVTATTTASIVDMERRVRNRNSASSQVCSLNNGLFSSGSASSAPTTMAVDTSASVDLVFTGQITNTGETITLETYEVWLLP